MFLGLLGFQPMIPLNLHNICASILHFFFVLTQDPQEPLSLQLIFGAPLVVSRAQAQLKPIHLFVQPVVDLEQLPAF